MRKLRVLLCLLLICITTVALSAAPQHEEKYSARQWENLIEEYDLEAVAEIPAGVTPLVVSSPGQLRELLSAARSSRKVINIQASNVTETGDLEIGESLRMTYAYVELEETDDSESPFVFHLEATVELAGSGSFWEISDCEEEAYITGSVLFLLPGPTSAHHHIATNKQSVRIDGEGVIIGYGILPNGEPYSFVYHEYDMTINYALYGG